MSTPFVARPSWASSTLPESGRSVPAPPEWGRLDEEWERFSAAARAAPGGASEIGAGACEFADTGADARGEATSGPAGAMNDLGTVEVEELGELAPFAASAGVTDLFVNGEAGLWVDRGAGAVREPDWERTEAEVRALAVRLIARGGRHIDEATPAVDVRLGTGIRVHAVLPPVSRTGTVISIRIPRAGRMSLADLVRAGAIDDAQRELLAGAIASRRNLLITGAGGSGKTTLLGALLAETPSSERIVVIEDVAELQISHPHVISLEARQPNLEGSGRLGLDVLLRESLRMRPDRIVVGECRGPELRELLSALNTGHDGGAGTLHANSLADVPARLEALGAGAGMSPESVARQAASAFDHVLHVERVAGVRRLAAIGDVELAGGRLTVVPR